MNLQVAAHQVEGYRVNTPVYEGPLDLLLQLIEHAELDITTLALAQVTDQYLVHLKQLQAENVERTTLPKSPVSWSSPRACCKSSRPRCCRASPLMPPTRKKKTPVKRWPAS